MLSITHAECHTQALYSQCRYAEFHCAEYCNAEFRGARFRAPLGASLQARLVALPANTIGLERPWVVFTTSYLFHNSHMFSNKLEC